MDEVFETNRMEKSDKNDEKDVKYIIEERINKTIVGRSSELECFKNQFNRVLEGGMGLTVVSGKPGIGKTFFVEHAASLVTGSNATYVHGKFRQYDNYPLTAVSEIIEQTVRHILTLPTESLKHIKNDLNQKLGVDSAIIISVCPYAEMLLGAHKAVNTESLEQLKYRVRKAVYQFLEIVSTALFPLIVFIDDLQWADTLSINVIEAICKDYKFLNLQLLLAYRDNNTSKDRLNPAKLLVGDSIFFQLDELAYEDIDQYIRLMFEQDIVRKDYLIRILYSLTLGNPFNINKILRLFMQEGVLSYYPANRKWIVRLEKMEQLNLPADIEQLLMQQIDRLESEDKQLLELIACYGGNIAFELLRALTDTEDPILNDQLGRLCKAYLLVKTIQDDNPQDGIGYSFTHDIVLKQVYNNLKTEEKSSIHYHIATTLTEFKNRRFASNDRLLTAVHLLRVDMPLLRQGKTKQWIEELYKAGIAARQGAAVELAMGFFERCAELLSGRDPKEKSRLSLDVHLELLECRFICGQAEESKLGFEAMLVKNPETENQIRIKRKYINLCAFSGDFEKVMELGLQILDCLNFKLDPKYLIPDLIKSRLLFSDKKIEGLKSAPDITDKRLLCILEILALMAPSAKRVSDKMPGMVALKLAILSARHGNSDYAPVAYASYCYVLFHILKDHKKGKRLEEVTLSLIESCENAVSKYVALCILSSMTHHWTNPLADTAGCLEQAFEEGEKEGSSLYHSYAITFDIITKYMMGAPLEGLTHYINDCRKKQKGLEHYLATYIYESYEKHIHQLEKGAPLEGKAFSGEYRYKTMYTDIIELNDDMIALQQLYLEGQTEKAYRLADDIMPRFSLHPEFVLYIEFLFYSILTRIAWHKNLTGAKKRSNKKLIKNQLKELKYWVRIYKGNHYARYALAQAEYNALFARGKHSDKLYREAMDFAEGQGNLPLEALANLMASKYHRDNHKLSGFYASEAVSLYKKWGAYYVGDLVAKNMGLANEAACSMEVPSMQSEEEVADSEKIAERDILFHLSKMEKMHEDEGYIYLLNLVIRQNYADYCAVFFEKSDEMYIKYEKRKGSPEYVHPDLINMNHISSLPHKILRYVARTETEILLDKECPYGIFAKDSYIMDKDKLSIACLPIKYLGVFIGIIYMEKTGEGGFSSSILPFVKGFVPLLLSKKTNIREVNMQNVLNPRNENSLFTGRELEVLKLVAQGLSNSEISKKLHITLGTVRNHLSNIYGKLEVDNRVKAVMRAKELKIIQM